MFRGILKKVKEQEEQPTKTEAGIAAVPLASATIVGVGTDVSLYTFMFLAMAKNGADALSFVFACGGATAPICAAGAVAGSVVGTVCNLGLFGDCYGGSTILEAYMNKDNNQETEESVTLSHHQTPKYTP